MRELELVYIAAPYAHENHLVMQLRHEIINRLCGKIINQFNCSIFSPISHGHMINTSMDRGFDKREYWMKADLKVLSHCSDMFVLMLDGWRESKGVTEELLYCNKNNINVRYIDPKLLIGQPEVELIERALIDSETNLDVLQYVIGEWGNETFPICTTETILAHLKDEVKELSDVDSMQPRDLDEASLKNIEAGKEAADVGLLLLHYCHKMGIRLGESMVNKFRVNQERKWSKEKNEKGFYSHVEDNTDS